MLMPIVVRIQLGISTPSSADGTVGLESVDFAVDGDKQEMGHRFLA